MKPRDTNNYCVNFVSTPQTDDDIDPQTNQTDSLFNEEAIDSPAASSSNAFSSTVTPSNTNTLFGRPKSATLPSGQKIIPAALILLHHEGPMQGMLVMSWFKRLGFKPIFIEKTTTELAIAELNSLQVPQNHVIQVVLVELNYSAVGRAEPNFTLLKALTTSEKIKPQFLIGCSFTPACISNLKKNDEFKDKVIAIQLEFAALEEALKKNDQPRKLSYQGH